MKTIYLIALIIISDCIAAQDPSFSLASENLTYVNPAFAGTAKNIRVGATYRNQWSGITANYITTNVYVDKHLGKFGGVGFKFIHDIAGEFLRTSFIYLDYAYKINLGKEGVLSLGVEAAYFQKSLDLSSLTFGDMISPTHGFTYSTNEVLVSSVSGFDLGAGLLYYNKFLFAGYAVHHLNQPNTSFTGGESNLPPLHNLYFGGIIRLGDFVVSPQVELKKQNDFESYLGWLKADYKFVTIGAGYRDKDALLLMAGVNFESFRINYAYDYTISKLGMATGGSHEVALQYLINKGKKVNERAFEVY